MITSWFDFFMGGWISMLLYGLVCMALFIRRVDKHEQTVLRLHYDIAHWQQVALVREREIASPRKPEQEGINGI